MEDCLPSLLLLPFSAIAVLQFSALWHPSFFYPRPVVGNRIWDQAKVCAFPHFSNMPPSQKPWVAPLALHELTSSHLSAAGYVFSQTFPLSENITYFSHQKLLIRSLLKKKNQQILIVLHSLRINSPLRLRTIPTTLFPSQRVDCAGAQLRLALTSDSAAALTFPRSLLLIHKKQSQICIMYSIESSGIQ